MRNSKLHFMTFGYVSVPSSCFLFARPLTAVLHSSPLGCIVELTHKGFFIFQLHMLIVLNYLVGGSSWRPGLDIRYQHFLCLCISNNVPALGILFPPRWPFCGVYLPL